MACPKIDITPMITVGIMISFISTILHTVGFSTKYWFVFFHNSTGVTDTTLGLWDQCTITNGVKVCNDNPNMHNAMLFMAVLECLALLAYIAALISAFHQMCLVKDRRRFSVTGLLNMVAGVFALVGIIMFAIAAVLFAIVIGLLDEIMHQHMDSYFDYSFKLCVAGAVGGLVSGILFIVADRCFGSSSETNEMTRIE